MDKMKFQFLCITTFHFDISFPYFLTVFKLQFRRDFIEEFVMLGLVFRNF